MAKDEIVLVVTRPALVGSKKFEKGDVVARVVPAGGITAVDVDKLIQQHGAIRINNEALTASASSRKEFKAPEAGASDDDFSNKTEEELLALAQEKGIKIPKKVKGKEAIVDFLATALLSE